LPIKRGGTPRPIFQLSRRFKIHKIKSLNMLNYLMKRVRKKKKFQQRKRKRFRLKIPNL